MEENLGHFILIGRVQLTADLVHAHYKVA